MFPEPRPTVMLMLGWWATHFLPSRQGHVAALPREPWAWVLTASLKKLRAGVFSSYHCSTCEGCQDGHTSTYWSLIKRKLKATDHHFEDNCPPHKSSVPLSTQIQHRLICLSEDSNIASDRSRSQHSDLVTAMECGVGNKNCMRRRDVDGRHFTEKNNRRVKDDFKVHTLKAWRN